MSPITTSPTTNPWLAVLMFAEASRVVRELLDGSAGVSVDGASLVDTELFCTRCRQLVMARCRLDAWCGFDADLKDQRLNCGCGGVLTRSLSPIISLEQAVFQTPLTK